MWTAGGQPDHLTFAGMRGGGKGGSTQQTSSTTGASQTQLPSWLTSAAQQAVGTAQDLSQTPYQPYTGQMVAGQDPMQTQAYQEVQQQQGSANPAYAASAQAYQGLLPSAAPMTAGATNQAASQLYGNYAQNVLAPTAGLLGNYLGNTSPATAQQVGQNTQQLMNPYTQSVINPMLQTAQQQLDMQNQQIAGNANNVGAFGGSRMGVEQGVAQAQSLLGTEQNVGNLLSTGYNAALQPGYNLAANASAQGMTAAQQLANMAQGGYTGYGQAAQGASTLGSTNLQAGLTAAANAPTQAMQQAQLAQQQAGALQAAGTAEQQQQQAELNAQMSQFYSAQQYPYQQLDTLIGGITGVPYGTSTATSGTGTGTQTTTPGLLNEITGGVGAASSIAGMFSDARIKTDINQVGETEGGTPVHTFRYKGDPSGQTHMGVIAQQLMQRQPEAVFRHRPSGLLAVDYSQVK